jgi:tetratricopeptide (TPR) repeat protein
MKTSKSRASSRRAPRPVRVPPPLTRGNERFEGSSVLTEYEGDLGVLLWQSLRNVLLWAETEPAKRQRLFSPGSDERRRVKLLAVEMEDTLRSPFAVIARLLADPEGADKKRVATACRKIAEWAEGKGTLATALVYMQAAALASNDPRLSYEVGRLARQRGEYARAETWFRRAILLGRQSGDWESYALAFVGLGNLYMQRGNIPGAHRAHLRAYRASRRKGLRKVQGMALHDLFGIAVVRNQVREAEELAASTLRAYGPSHPRLPFFAHDVGVFWMERGYYAPAITVFNALVPHLRRPNDQAPVLANITRAAAGSQNRNLFEDAWKKAWDVNTAVNAGERTAATFESLATSAAVMGEWDRAVDAAERAIEVATQRGESHVITSAEAVLVAAREKRAGMGHEEPAVEPWVSGHAEELAATLARSLNAAVAAR